MAQPNERSTFPKHGSPEQQDTSSPCPSHVSIKDDQSMDHPLDFKGSSSEQQFLVPCSSLESVRSDQSMDPPITLQKSSFMFEEIRDEVQSILRTRYQCLNQDLPQTSSFSAPLKDIYTELYITEGETGDIFNKHDSRWIETACRRPTEERPILLKDIFEPLPGQNHSIKSVLTKGVAGIGKTVSVQKFILDWAEGEANQDIHLIFPLPFRELNLLKNESTSLIALLQLFMDTEQLDLSLMESKILFILDGLDECRLSLNFQNTLTLCDVTHSAPVDVLLTNLIAGNLLPSSHIWITSRPAAADLIPAKFVQRVTEVRGFNDPQKEEYISKRIRDKSLALEVITHLKSTRSLYTMCQIPVFCCISATVFEQILHQGENEEIPKTLTQLYTHYLMVQVRRKNERPCEKNVSDVDVVFKLGKLAFQQLEQLNLIFYKNDLQDCGIGMQEASVYSGLFTEIFREEPGRKGNIYSFIHLSVQEHLAAFYVYFSFMNQNINHLKQPGLFSVAACLAQVPSKFELQQDAVKKALNSSSGHLDLFLCFLLGFSVEPCQSLLKHLLVKKESDSDCKGEIVSFIKEKIKENPPPEKLICLFHCLNELNEHSLLEEVQGYLQSGSKINTKLTSSQWSAMIFILLTSGQKLDVFNFNDYIGPCITAEQCLLRLQSVVEASRTAKLCDHALSGKFFYILDSVLTSKTSCLRELIITRSIVDDQKFKLLCTGLKNSQCKLEVLKLEFCGLSDKACDYMASALKSNPSHLKELDLSGNKLSYLGLKSIFTELQNPGCKLQKLWMRNCSLKIDACGAVASILRSEPSSLRELNLSKNEFGDDGIKLLTSGLENPHCELKRLRLEQCKITHEGCTAVAIALKLNPSHLRELDLSGNGCLGNTGVIVLSSELEATGCHLEILRLENCNITNEGCAALASALKENPFHLKELDLSWNKLGDSGVRELSTALQNPLCKVEVLRLKDCSIKEEGCAALELILKSNPNLKDLDLSQNKIGTLGVKRLSAALEKPVCTLKILRLEYCDLKDESCAVLASALILNPTHLRELHLYMNHFSVNSRGRQLLSSIKDDPKYELRTLQLSEIH